MSLISKASFDFVRLPADSIGKRLGANKYYELAYTALLIPIVVGDYILGANGALGEIVHIIPSSPTAGTIYVFPENGNSFVAGEAVTVDGTPAFTVSGSPVDYHLQMSQLVGKNNPLYGQNIDKDGAAFIRFTEGQQQLDSYGVSRQVRPTTLAAFRFLYDLNAERWTPVTATGGTVTHDNAPGAAVLATTTASGSSAVFATNIAYPSIPGNSQLVSMPVSLGDAGKANCIRRWGYFDANNGMFFQLSGTQLSVVIRSNATGGVVDTVVNQADWNTDSLSSIDSSDGMVLDVTKINSYWFNFHTVTAGKIRFGVVNQSGERIVVHNAIQLNSNALPALGSVTLPMRCEVVNTGATGSTSELRIYGGTIHTEGPAAADDITISRFSSAQLPAPITLTTGDEYHVATWRAGATFNGRENHIVTIPHEYSLHVVGAPIVFKIRKNATLSGGTYFPMGSVTPVEASMSGTIAGGRDVFSEFVAIGSHKEHFSEHVWGLRGENMALRSDGSYGDTYSLTVQKIVSGDPNATVYFSAVWADLG
jgi:hypothetical protein